MFYGRFYSGSLFIGSALSNSTLLFTKISSLAKIFFTAIKYFGFFPSEWIFFHLGEGVVPTLFIRDYVIVELNANV